MNVVAVGDTQHFAVRKFGNIGRITEIGRVRDIPLGQHPFGKAGLRAGRFGVRGVELAVARQRRITVEIGIELNR